MNISDEQLIEKYIDWCKERGFNQSKMAMIAKKSKAWATLIVTGRIKKLNFDTRNHIISILGIS